MQNLPIKLPSEGPSQESGVEALLTRNAPTVMIGVLAAAFVAALLVGVLYFAVLLPEPLSIDPAKLGQAGDFFGGLLNPVLSFLSVLALLVTLVIQSSELRQSREALKVSQEELKLTREAQASAAEALQSQNRAIQLQSFEQTFFAMLRLLEDVVGQLRYSGDLPTVHTEGRGAMARYFNAAFQADSAGMFYQEDESEYLSRTQKDFNSFVVSDSSGGVVAYLRTLQNLLEHMEANAIRPYAVYPKTLRSLLTRVELRVVYRACFVAEWSELKRLIENYRLLAHMREGDSGWRGGFHRTVSPEAFVVG